MDIEFHYYITYLISIAAGFSSNTAYKIAYSSQYVDDNTVEHVISRYPKQEYRNHISQTCNIMLPVETLARIYTCFHFIPGDDHNSPHKLKTTPGCEMAKTLLGEALKDRNPYWIGVAAHAYVDTWAHQNFSGIFDDNNAATGFAESFIPNIGHADFGSKPDKINLIWQDHRLPKPEVNNKSRFIQAAQKLFYEFRAFINPGSKTTIQDAVILAHQLHLAIGREYNFEHRWFNLGKNKRIQRYHKLAKELSGMPIPEYDQNDWFNQTVEKRTNELYFKNGYHMSHWYCFQEAAVAHQYNAWKRIEARVMSAIPQIGYHNKTTIWSPPAHTGNLNTDSSRATI